MGKRKCLVVGFCAFFALYNIGPNSSGNQSDDREQAILVPVPVDPPDVVPPDGATNPDPNYCRGNTTTDCATKTEPKDACTKKKGNGPHGPICSGEIIGDPVYSKLIKGSPGNNMRESEDQVLCVWRYKCADGKFPYSDCVRGDPISRAFTNTVFHGGTCTIPPVTEIEPVQ